MVEAFANWSPAQLAHALGYRINLVKHACGERTAYFERGDRRHPLSHAQACSALSRLARLRGIDPSQPPQDAPRALLDGVEQLRVVRN